MSADGPGGPDPAGDTGAVAPAQVEVRPGSARLGFFPYLWAFRAPGRRLRVVLLVSLPVYLLGLLAVVPLQLTGGSVVANGSIELFGLAPQWLVVAGVLLLLGVLATLVAHAAATLVAVAEAVRVSSDEQVAAPSLRAVVAAAVRRLPTLLVLWLLGVFLVVVLAAGVVASTFTEVPLWLTVAGTCLVGWLVFSPFAVAWPVALAERRGPFGALRRSVQLTGGRAFRLGLYVLVFGFGIPGGLSYLVREIPALFGRWLDAWPAALLAGVLGWAVAVLGLVVLASVQVSALVYDKVVADSPGRDEIDRDRLLGVLDLRAPEWRWVATRRWDVTLRAVAGLLVPGLLAVGLLWVNPAGVPAFTRAELSDSTSDLRHRLLAMSDGSVTVVTTLTDEVYIGRCVDTRCVRTLHDDEEDSPLILLGAGVTVGPGGDRLAFTGWRRDDDQLPVLRLVTCRPQECTDDAVEDAPVLDRYEPRFEGDQPGQLDVRTAVARDGYGGYVVVSFLEHGKLSVYHCADERCSNPEKTVLDEPELGIIPHRSDVLGLAARDGRVAVVLTNTDTGELTQYSCGDLDCTEPQRTVVVEAGRNRSELETQYRMGAQVAFGGSGQPVIAYRDLLDGTVRLVSCADLACKRRGSHALTGPGWGHPWPTLAVDRGGRPLVVTYDLAARQLTLVACQDVGCKRRTAVPLDQWDDGPGNTAVTVDGDDRPVVLRIDIDPVGGLFDHGRSDVFVCDEARCGAP